MATIAHELDRFLRIIPRVYIDPYTDEQIDSIIARLQALKPGTIVRQALEWQTKAHVSQAGITTPYADAFLGHWLRKKMQPQALLIWAATNGAVQLAHEALSTGMCSVSEQNFLPLRWAILGNHILMVKYFASCGGEFDIDDNTLRGAFMYDLHEMISFLNTLSAEPLPQPFPKTMTACNGDRTLHREEVNAYFTMHQK